ncbi:MAG TPA: hypothetical protein VG406_10355 [Isosphaeraceae bacterium]|jgi:hypothetical protein|nr:hypothetical protein [Isosphaeraceae bacterium]
MILSPWNSLKSSIDHLSELYPDMRLGQLLEMVALLSSEGVPVGVAEVEDDRLRDAAEAHARGRRRRLEIEGDPESARRGPKAELLDALGQAYQNQGDRRFGRFVERLAAATGSRLYDVEDEQLIAAARGLDVGMR